MKYVKFVRMIDEEVDRVIGLILRCIDDVKVYDEVLVDLKRCNVEWQVN